jgi:hypothetical protein
LNAGEFSSESRIPMVKPFRRVRLPSIQTAFESSRQAANATKPCAITLSQICQ